MTSLKETNHILLEEFFQALSQLIVHNIHLRNNSFHRGIEKKCNVDKDNTKEEMLGYFDLLQNSSCFSLHSKTNTISQTWLGSLIIHTKPECTCLQRGHGECGGQGHYSNVPNKNQLIYAGVRDEDN